MRPYMECPSYDRCAVNKCPLDPKYHERKPQADDAEKKCRALKNSRRAIAARYPGILAFDGLTGREYQGYQLLLKGGN